MFFRKKEELSIFQKSLESLEKSQKNTELMVNAFYQMIEKEDKGNRIIEEFVTKSQKNTELMVNAFYQMLEKENKENQAIEELAAISQKNMELMVSAFCQILEKESREKQDIEEVTVIDEEEKKRAAYALNLCTVSISQIIDYNDENILEQEYETILNNLNLENMPKDEALLNILKQILDTVTFFRIQEGDKAFIEKEYQQKMKNAIWSSIPNFGLIVAGGNPFTVAVSLASQVGIGYMNYRRVKAENALDKEKQGWQLQRAAIEQLNGLRRELFDASWRLADRYEFRDEYRLTEKQITQYNKVLMDPDDNRRYERLEAMSEYFAAYPPFWYYFGHAANAIAQSAITEIKKATAIARKAIMEGDERSIREQKTIVEDNEAIYCRYRELALEYFDTYMQSNRYALLREDSITSSCALEYIDLLNPETNKKKIKELLDCAIKMSGKQCDVLQLCAISYLRLGEIKPATDLLRYLVNEKYNTITNAQLLSTIYVSRIIDARENTYKVDYRILEKKVPVELLFPIPKGKETIDALKKEFIENQRYILLKRYAHVIRCCREKYMVLFNKTIPAPFENKQYPDIFFLDDSDYRKERLNEYKNLFSNKNKADEFWVRLADSNYSLAYLDVFNEMMNALETITPGDIYERQEIVQHLAGCIEEKIMEKRDTLNKLQACMNKDFGSKEFEVLFNLSFDTFTKEFFGKLILTIHKHVNSLDDMECFSLEETALHDFCVKQGIPEFKVISDLQSQRDDDDTGNSVFFSSELLGGQAFERSEILKLARKMAKYMDENISGIIIETGAKKQNIHLYTTSDSLTKQALKDYFKKGRKKYYLSNQEYQEKIFAVLVDDSFGVGKTDLVFTTEGIFCDSTSTGFSFNPNITAYSAVTNENNRLNIGTDRYKSGGVNIIALYNLIQELSQQADVLNNDQDDDKYLLDEFHVKSIKDIYK